MWGLIPGWESEISLPEPSVKQAGYKGSRSKCPSPSFLCFSFASQQSPVLHWRREQHSTSRGILCQTKANLKQFKSQMRRWSDAPPSSCGNTTCSCTAQNPLSPFLRSPSPFSFSPLPDPAPLVRSLALSHSGMHFYPLWLKPPQARMHTLHSPHKHMQITEINKHTKKKKEKRKTPVSFFRVFVFNVTGYFLLLCNRTRVPVFYSCYRHVLKHSTIWR